MAPRPEGKPTVERMDNSLGYVMIQSPDGSLLPNIRRASYKEQANNTSRNRHIEIDGVMLTRTRLPRCWGWNRTRFGAS